MDAHPKSLERYAFFWSQARLVIAAIALFLGGVPPVYYLIRYNYGLFGLTHSLLILCWIISGAASVYLLYRWYGNKQVIFGGKKPKDTTAFFVSVVSGINLGLAGLLRTNIGMTISSNKFIFIIVGVLYLVSAFYLNQRWSEHGKKMF